MVKTYIRRASFAATLILVSVMLSGCFWWFHDSSIS
jgi:hypothetical protein